MPTSSRDDPVYKAERTLVGVAIENTQKEEVIPERFPGYTDGDVSAPGPEIEQIDQRVVGGNRNVFRYEEGQYEYSNASWTLNPYDGWPLAWLMGSESYDDTNDEHTITAKQDGPPPTLTAEYVYIGADGQDDLVMPYVGLFPTSGEISQSNEGLLEVQIDAEALGVPSDVRSGGARDTAETDASMLPDRQPWKFSGVQSELSLFGSSFARVTDFSLSIETGSEPEWYLQSDRPQEPYEAIYGNTENTLDVTLNVSDGTLFNELVTEGGGDFTGNIVFEKPQATDETLEIIMGSGDMQIESAPHDIPEDGAIGVDASFVAPSVEIVVTDPNSGDEYLAAGTAA